MSYAPKWEQHEKERQREKYSYLCPENYQKSSMHAVLFFTRHI
jgi:hypothetical protein